MQSIFEDKSKLSPGYIPGRVVDRDEEFRELIDLFKPVLEGKASQRVFISGSSGSGRTVLARVFSRELKSFAQKNGLKVDRVYINCRRCRTPWAVLDEVSQISESSGSCHGFARAELLEEIRGRTSSDHSHLLLILDNLDPFVQRNDSDLLYSLSRLREGSKEPARLSLLGVMEDLGVLDECDPATQSSLLHNTLELKEYSRSQLWEILRNRAEKALKPEAASEKVLDHIADVASGYGDAGYALLLLRRAGEIGSREGEGSILRRHADRAVDKVCPRIRKRDLTHLSGHELLVLLSLARFLQERGDVLPLTGELREFYEDICGEWGEKPRRSSRFHRYLEELSARNLIEVAPFSSEHRGRSRKIGLASTRSERVERLLKDFLSDKAFEENRGQNGSSLGS